MEYGATDTKPVQVPTESGCDILSRHSSTKRTSFIARWKVLKADRTGQRDSMSLKFTKEISTHLFKYVKSVDVRFNPFDSRTRSARELLRQVQSKRFTKANPKLKIVPSVLSTPDPPVVIFKFADDTEKTFDSQEYVAVEMMYQVFLVTMQMNSEYEIEGKSIDDLM